MLATDGHVNPSLLSVVLPTFGTLDAPELVDDLNGRSAREYAERPDLGMTPRRTAVTSSSRQSATRTRTTT